MRRVTFEDIVARGSARHAPARPRFPLAPAAAGVIAGLVVCAGGGVIARILIGG